MPITSDTRSKIFVILIIVGCVGAAVILGVLLFELPWKDPGEAKVFDVDFDSAPLSQLSPFEKANYLLERFPLIDGHNDLPWNIRKLAQNDLRKVDFNSDLTKFEPWASYNESHTDIPRLRKGHVGAQFWVAYTDCESQGKDSVLQTIEQIDLIHRLVDKYPNDFQFCYSSDCIEYTVRHSKKIASLIGIEGGHSIQSSPSVLRQMYRLGARYMTLTHTCNTPWADASPVDGPENPPKPTNNGLSEFGLELIDEMNRLGMMVDISHVSEATMKAVLARSKAPVIFSHSGSKVICNHHRNVADNVLQELKTNKGIIMINFYSAFIQCNKSRNATLNDVVEHIDHIKNVIGPDYLGIGGDYDGVDSVPIGLEDVSKYPYLFAALIERGWSLNDLKKVSYQNILRVMREVEIVSEKLKTEPPMENIISGSELKYKNVSTNSCITSKSLAMLVQLQANGTNMDDEE